MAAISYKLNTGASIPAIGLGTWQSPQGQVRAAVAQAIKAGYRHIDCAYVYQNEQEVGEGIRDGLAATGLSRCDLFITTKLWCSYHRKCEGNPIAMNGNGNHEKFPTLPEGEGAGPDVDWDRSHVATYKEMEGLLRTGKVRAIGVSNYSEKYLDELLPQVDVVPAVNQIELHPLLPQPDVVNYCKEKARGGPLLENPQVVQLAKQKGVSPGSILLSYHVTRGCTALAKSVSPARIEENLKVLDLSEADMAMLGDISKAGVKRFIYHEMGVDFGFPDKS
ncbi:NADP-dependent oxidoreductase domain-containing protein [Aspergillus carlsbadensis]|nr:NADP-dependent oxidoreductase domain-containing protein [Aspergillus carlsbadensis]